jgi:hypothetical protein
VTGAVDQALVECISDLLDEPRFPLLPHSLDAAADNRRARAAIAAMPNVSVPLPFLLAILMQESNGKHFCEPQDDDEDTFVIVGVDTNNAAHPEAITSRGYGIGQFTYFHHPPTPNEVIGCIADPVANVAAAIAELRDKFYHFVNGQTSGARADDRIHEIGAGPLRVCRFAADDLRYLTDCRNCALQADAQDIIAGVTPLYPGSSAAYERTQYHSGSYKNVPRRSHIQCDWPYAVRRYNGSGPNSYDYQAEVLLRLAAGAF